MLITLCRVTPKLIRIANGSVADGGAASLSAGTVRSSLIKRPFTSQLFNRAVIHIDIHIVLSARHCVEARRPIRGAAILFAGELPEGVSLPRRLRKVRDVPFKTRIPQTSLREDIVRAVLV
jgi:hypothetical protein